MALGPAQPKKGYRTGVKSSRSVGLTTLPPSCAESLDILGSLNF
jgi:hypothetical protein